MKKRRAKKKQIRKEELIFQARRFDSTLNSLEESIKLYKKFNMQKESNELNSMVVSINKMLHKIILSMTEEEKEILEKSRGRVSID